MRWDGCRSPHAVDGERFRCFDHDDVLAHAARREQHTTAFQHWTEQHPVPNTDRLGAVLRSLNTSHAYPRGRFRGAGYVMVVRQHTAAAALLTLRLLRRHGGTLPAEVWHRRGEISEAVLLSMRAYNAASMTFEQYCEEAELVPACWNAHALSLQLGPWAVVHSRFETVLIVEPGTVPVANLDVLFQSRQLALHGAVLWSGAETFLSATSPLWAALGLAPRRMMGMDGAVAMIDKSRMWDALQVSVYLHTPHVLRLARAADTLLLAALITNTPVHVLDAPLIVGSRIGGAFHGHTWALLSPGTDAVMLLRHEPAHLDLAERWRLSFTHMQRRASVDDAVDQYMCRDADPGTHVERQAVCIRWRVGNGVELVPAPLDGPVLQRAYQQMIRDVLSDVKSLGFVL